ncbi:hypothetical protein ACIGHB_29840 [Streptomyces sp. NPDC085460]|uniref:hypothetical protein n=1 Tax=Streptomyces sp. NPDC085460 TaxID=3365723 RepID=UPI0037D6F84D
MPVSGRIDVGLGQIVLRDVSWTWGLDFPSQRRWTDGWGVSVELPAVIELLDLIGSGAVDVATARAELTKAAEALDAAHDPHHGNPAAQRYARCFGDCETCQAAEPEFRQILAAAQARAAKALDHASYPYVVLGTTVHQSGCYHASPARHLGGNRRRSEVRTDLKLYAHDAFVSVYSGEAMDWEALVGWTKANIGPRGGPRFKACGTCHPRLP